MQKKYDHRKIEKKWQNFWKKNKTFTVSIDPNKPKFYILDMFPYPSGEGLHVGHVTGYTGTDIVARFKRQQGFNVLHPMGWDSFGLPAEQYAIKTGTHPAITTKKNINTYRRQLESLGFSYDWSREITTSDPSYYKWTQWIFTKLYEKNLAYEDEAYVNFCPRLGTVLANEEVEDGKSKEGRFPVEKRSFRQWILKITKYAERLISDLDFVDWPENLKKLQRNWIGKSEGVKVIFRESNTLKEIEVFTTRPDTLFGATYLVLSPEHPLVATITSPDKQKEVQKYQKKASQKSDLKRTDLAVDKTGIFTGAFAINPVNEEKIPIWLSDYVLISYGTGAIMAVPAHDERDFEFATKFNLPIKSVYDPLVKDEDIHKLKKTEKEIREGVVEGKMCWTKEGKTINSGSHLLSINDLDTSSAKEKVVKWLEIHKKGGKAVSYKLRDWLFSRQRYWGEPIPIIHFEDGTKRILDLDELPLIPPQIEDYKPAKEGKSPLAKEEQWVNIIDPKTNKKGARETNTMPQWAGSCWYYLRFCDPSNEKEAWKKTTEKYWMPVDLYVGGAEHAVLHLLYVRFWHKVLYDLGLVHTPEPFKKFRCQGVVTAPSYKLKSGKYVSQDEVVEKNGKFYHAKTSEKVTTQMEKMSKSKHNGITPDEIIDEFGADTLRLYEMFMGPFDKEKIWNADAVSGCNRFLCRFYDMAFSDKVSLQENEEALSLGYRLVNGVSKDIENLQFNTAIAKMMEFLNTFSKLPFYPQKVVKMVTQMLYPFAPHTGEEIWEHLGEEGGTISFAPLPPVDQKYLIDEMVTYIIQVNGKLRGKLELKKDSSQDEVLALAEQDPKIQKYLKEGIIKVIHVPNKLINIVVPR